MRQNTKLAVLLVVIFALVGGAIWMNQSSKSDQTASNDSTPGQAASDSQNKTTNPADIPARPQKGYRAPDFTLTDLNGKTVKLSDLKGKKVFINFWASWCPPCNDEMPELVKMSEKYKGQVEFYGVNLTASDSVDGAKGFVNKYKIPFPTLLDKEGNVSDQYQVIVIPTTFTVDANGIIADRIQGGLTATAMEDTIEKLLRR